MTYAAGAVAERVTGRTPMTLRPPRPRRPAPAGSCFHGCDAGISDDRDDRESRVRPRRSHCHVSSFSVPEYFLHVRGQKADTAAAVEPKGFMRCFPQRRILAGGPTKPLTAMLPRPLALLACRIQFGGQPLLSEGVSAVADGYGQQVAQCRITRKKFHAAWNYRIPSRKAA